MKQHSFASLDYARKQTRSKQFLSEMARCMPWRALLALTTCLRPVRWPGGQMCICCAGR